MIYGQERKKDRVPHGLQLLNHVADRTMLKHRRSKGEEKKKSRFVRNRKQENDIYIQLVNESFTRVRVVFTATSR